MNILLIQNRLLFPANTGGRIRTLGVLRHLANRHRITYLCNGDPAEKASIGQMCELGLRVEVLPRSQPRWGSVRFYGGLAINVFSPLPFNIAKHFDPNLRSMARKLLADEPFDLIVCDFLSTALHAVGLAGPPRVLFQHNVEAQILRRHAENSSSWLRRRYMTMQWKRMVRFEREIGRHFDRVIAVSEQDRHQFESEYDWRHVTAIDTDVDTDYFQPAPGIERDGEVLFLGSLDWLPNQEGVIFFAQHVWPHVRRRRPDAKFRIVGRNPSPEIRRLGSLPGIEVVGSVPDVRPYLAEAALVVVPLLVGGGTRLKIFEALAAGKAVVSTTVGCEGLPVQPDRHLVVKDAPEELSESIVGLLGSSTLRDKLGAAGRALVCERHSTGTAARQFESACRDTVARCAHRAASDEAEIGSRAITVP